MNGAQNHLVPNPAKCGHSHQSVKVMCEVNQAGEPHPLNYVPSEQWLKLLHITRLLLYLFIVMHEWL